MMRILLAACAAVFASAAFAEDAAPGHHLYHTDFYSKLMRPDTGTSCCNDQDCRPAQHRITATGIEFYVHDRWVVVPASRTMERVTPDGGGHWCGTRSASPGTIPITYCAVVPFHAN